MIPFFLQRVPLVKQELLILPQQTSSSLCRNHDPTLSTTSATSEAGNCLFFHSKQVHPCVVIMIPPFLRRVPLVKQELLILPQQTSLSLCRNHDLTLSTTSATSEAGTAYPSTANKFTSGFCWVRIVQTNCYARFLEIIFLFSCSFSFGHPLYCLSDLHLLIIPVVSSNFS